MTVMRRAQAVDQIEIWLQHAELDAAGCRDEAVRVWLGKIAGQGVLPTPAQQRRMVVLRSLLALRGGL